ncbi:unnamed protein product [Euphydryas editha]|uniref:Integrase catalytic domain-containing protein n=1 Tax=Euphydryas editha TaxID=104508 RepID=A0AAU9TLD3_EUPED|nr:unnamed protein product [Euphydryas editha]
MANKHNYYLPHHGVIRESSTTSKLRVVFDASAVTTSGKSFNDIQMIGPKTQDDLFSILLRFREHKYAVTGDVEKQRSLQQIIYRFNSNEPFKTYTLNTVTYGTSSAPYLATFFANCLVSLANETSNLNTQRSMKHDFYIDDYLGGANSIESAVELAKDVKSTLESAKFNLRKWQSNSRVILESLNFSNDCTNKKLNLDSSPSKTLGLYWDTSVDTFYFSINNSFEHQYTKRNILSFVSQVFDPLGLEGPCILQAKILLQHLWLQKCGWDDEVSPKIKHEFTNIISCLCQLNSIRIPRWTLQDNPQEVQLHVFTDASERGYGACVYVRTISTSGLIHVCLLISKNKVSPLKPTTIPRLELCGALLELQMAQKRLLSYSQQEMILEEYALLMASKPIPKGGRNLAKSIVHACIRCTRHNAKSPQPIMANLPAERKYLEFPVLNTGVDYAGPILIADRKERGCKLQKSYICVFICFAVKAVHLELVTDLSKEAFLAAFNRFISRRGKPQNIYSDNGTTFVGACNDLKRDGVCRVAEVQTKRGPIIRTFNNLCPLPVNQS